LLTDTPLLCGGELHLGWHERGLRFFCDGSSNDNIWHSTIICRYLKRSYDLLLAVYQSVGMFGKEFKYTIGEKLKNEALVERTLALTSLRRNKMTTSPC